MIFLPPEKIPRHIAIIMDGNGRWALRQNKFRYFGHSSAIDSVREVIRACTSLGISYLTLYTFSTENWHRPKREVKFLINLLEENLKETQSDLLENNIRFSTIGDISRFPQRTQDIVQKQVELTAQNTGLSLILALSYSGRWDLLQAISKLAHEVKKGRCAPEDIGEDLLSAHLATHPVPDPELLIRTGGDMRISNFLLWQMAYTELYVTPTLWPEFKEKDLLEALSSYASRERRFGKTSEQIRNLP
ncbi:MAG: isoprenyl transferase [Cytophagales bacterium]|nr:isoprenyl transferase [Cytophagales bacterium]